MSKYRILVSNNIKFCSGLPESEIKELLGSSTYEKARIAFNKNQISKALQSQHTDPNKSDSEMKRKAKKRTKEDLLLQCDEKVAQPSIKEENTVRQTKRDLKMRSKLDRSPSFGKNNELSANFENQNSRYLNASKAHMLNVESPKLHQKAKRSILDSCAQKNFFDSIDNISVCIDESIDVNSTPLSKYMISPSKIRINELQTQLGILDHKADCMENIPCNERLSKFWLSNLDNDPWKKHKYGKLSNLSLAKELEKPFVRGTPLKNFKNLQENFSPANENLFISPKKGFSFGRDIHASSPIKKIPVLRKVYELEDKNCEIFDDDLTKAEYSNLFSNKSNHIQ